MARQSPEPPTARTNSWDADGLQPKARWLKRPKGARCVASSPTSTLSYIRRLRLSASAADFGTGHLATLRVARIHLRVPYRQAALSGTFHDSEVLSIHLRNFAAALGYPVAPLRETRPAVSRATLMVQLSPKPARTAANGARRRIPALEQLNLGSHA
jgi:hypothetical protein